MHTGFGSRVVGLTRLSFVAIDRRNLDDASPTFFDHVWHDLFGDVEHGVQVGVNHCVPIVARHF